MPTLARWSGEPSWKCTWPGTHSPWFYSRLGKRLCVLQHPHQSQTLVLKKRTPPIGLPSLWGTPVQAESLLMTHPWEMLSQWLSRSISANPWHWSGYLQGACKPLTLIGVPTGCLQTPDTDRGTCRVPANPWHWLGYLQGACKSLMLIRVPTGCLQTPDADRSTYRVPANHWHWSGYYRRTYPSLRYSKTSRCTGSHTVRFLLNQWHLIGRVDSHLQPMIKERWFASALMNISHFGLGPVTC